MAFQLSPSVNVSEIDLTNIVPVVSTTIGAFVGAFQWGPVDQRTLIGHENALVNTFGQPNGNTFVSFFSAAGFLAYGNNLKIVRSVGPAANNATAAGSGLLIKNSQIWRNSYYNGTAGVGNWAARYPGDVGNALKVSVCPSANAYSLNLTSAQSITANTTANSNSVAVSANVIPYIATGDLVKVGSLPYLQVTAITANGLYITVNNSTLVSNSLTANSLSRNWFYYNYVDGAPGTSAYAASVGGTNDEMHVVVVDATGKITNLLNSSLLTQTANTVVEVYPFVSKGFDAINNDGSTNYVRDVIATKSHFIHWMQNLPAGTNWGNSVVGTTFTDVQVSTYEQLGGGQTDLPTDASLETSWGYFQNADEVDVSLLITGNSSPTVGTYVIQNVAEARKDCVAFISPKQGDVVDQVGSEVTNIIATRNLYPSSSYAVMDSGWKYLFDKYNNTYRWVPLNADIAGLCVKTDTLRDPWWSPAGFNRGQIKNVVKLAWNPKGSVLGTGTAERDSLYTNGVNPCVFFDGEGPVLFGDKTMQNKPSAFDRINVRRLFIVLEKAIATAAKYSLFEFNDEFTRASFVSLVTPFLRDIKGRRGIYDFRVVCDETNNTPEVIDSNRFVGDIYIKPARAINFIQLNFIAVRTGVDFTEIAGRF